MAAATASLSVPLVSSFVAPASSSRNTVSNVSNGSRVFARASSSWLPGEPRPEYLDGSAPADYGFDPFGFGKVPSNLERHREAELIHSRWAMLAVPGVLIPEILGLDNWVSAQSWAAQGGQATYLGVPVPWGTLAPVLAINTLAVVAAEATRNNESDPEKRKYPGGFFDPLGFSKGDAAKLDELRTKELNNGRLAMVAFLGFSVQAAVRPGTGPLQNLLDHLADPLGVNIATLRLESAPTQFTG